MLEPQLLAGDLDLDDEGVRKAGEGAEGAAQEIAELVFPGQPDGVGESDGIQRPLGRPVEGEIGAARSLACLDGHLAHGEDVGLRVQLDVVGKVELEAIALGGMPHEPGITEGDGQFSSDHTSTLDDAAVSGA